MLILFADDTTILVKSKLADNLHNCTQVVLYISGNVMQDAMQHVVYTINCSLGEYYVHLAWDQMM